MLKKITSATVSSSLLLGTMFSPLSASAGFFDADGEFPEVSSQSINSGEEYVSGQSRLTAEGMNNIIKALKYLKTSMVTKFVDGTTATDAVFTGGNVGIGKTNPTEKLDIKDGWAKFDFSDQGEGGILISNGSSPAKGRVTSYGVPGGAISVSANGVFSGSGLAYDHDDPSLAYWEMSFDPRNGQDNFRIKRAPAGATTNAVDFLRINANGNVGIGKTNPTEKLDVDGNVKATAFIGDGSQLTGIPDGAFTGTDDLNDNSVTGDAGYKLTTKADGSTARDVGAEFVITDEGNVGIGTDYPTKKLDILGGTKITTNGYHIPALTLDAIPGTGEHYLSFKGSQGGELLIKGHGAQDVFYIGTTSALIAFTDDMQFNGEIQGGYNGDLELSQYPGYAINFEDAAENVLMSIATGGNVGIGTTTPTEKLDVAGNIKSSSLAGTYTNGSAYVCVNNSGVIYASETACP